MEGKPGLLFLERTDQVRGSKRSSTVPVGLVLCRPKPTQVLRRVPTQGHRRADMSELKIKEPCCLNCDYWKRIEMSKLGDMTLRYGMCEYTLDLEGKFEIEHCDNHRWK